MSQIAVSALRQNGELHTDVSVKGATMCFVASAEFGAVFILAVFRLRANTSEHHRGREWGAHQSSVAGVPRGRRKCVSALLRTQAPLQR